MNSKDPAYKHAGIAARLEAERAERAARTAALMRTSPIRKVPAPAPRAPRPADK